MAKKNLPQPASEFPSRPPIGISESSIIQQVSKFDEVEATHNLRQVWIDAILPIFKRTNAVILFLVLVLAALDAVYIGLNFIEPNERLITENVVMAAIAASVAQVGAAAYSITKSLFRGGSEEKTESIS